MSNLVAAHVLRPAEPSAASGPRLAGGAYLIYIDVWLRHRSALDDDLIREKGLGGPDTAARAKTLWQILETDRLFRVV